MAGVVVVCGSSGSGKTTFLESLIGLLTREKVVVRSIKHSGKKLEVDKPGSDTARHMAAGSEVVVGVSPDMLFRVERVGSEATLAMALSSVGPCDLVIVEGFKKSPMQRIEVVSKRAEADSLVSDPNVIACAGFEKGPDLETDGRVVPYFRIGAKKDLRRAAELLKRCVVSRKGEFELNADGENIPLNGFVETIVGNVLKGLFASLKGVESASELTFTYRPLKRSRNKGRR
jgi:molybdopterin-guanine dinucleotide biosynthesis adapter protein